MWNIGSLKIDGRVVLGPMSGYTSRSYRDFMKPFGVAVSVTELISDSGIVHGFRRTLDYVEFGPNYPTGLQLFGSNPEILAKAAETALKINPNIDFFDVNMGCPVPKVIRSGSGSALLEDPAKCGEIIRSIKKSVDVPVTAKIRLGKTIGSVNFREVIKELTDAGVDAVALHVRTREERYSGKPHYDLVDNLQSEMDVPLIISGNIYSLDDAIDTTDITGAAAVMVARGGVGNPFLVTQIDHYFRTGEKLPNPTISQQVEWCISLADALVDEIGEEMAGARLRSFAPRFISGCYGSREYRNRLALETRDRESMIKLLREIEEKMGSERIFSDGRMVYDEDS